MSTEDDAEIARILGEDYASQCSTFESNATEKPKASSPSPTKALSNETVEEKNSLQFDEDSEIAFILQIEEIVLSEHGINKKTTKVTNGQLEKTHADMTKALQPAEQTDLISRIYGMFVTIQNRYADCQAKNQPLIDQIQKFSIVLYPLLISFKMNGKLGVPKASVPSLALALITSVLGGSITMNDAKQLLFNMFLVWNEYPVWYEFLEQLVYILVAVTVPLFAQGALDKIKGKISS